MVCLRRRDDRGGVLPAVSANSDPTRPWKGVKLPLPPIDPYMKMGVDKQGSVFGCHGAKLTPSARPGIVWYELRISDGALLQEGFVDDPKCDYLHPSLAVDSQGNIGVGCTRTSETEFPSVYVMMHAATDPANTMRAPVLAAPGTTYYRYSGHAAINLSHYTTTCIEPSHPDLLWTYQAYGNSTVDKQWCTAWAAFRLSVTDRSRP